MLALGQNGVNWVEGEHIKLDTEEACDAFMQVHDLIYKDHISAAGLGDQDHYNTFVSEVTDGFLRQDCRLHVRSLEVQHRPGDSGR